MLTPEVRMSHSVPAEPPSADRRVAPLAVAAYTPAEWDLLTELPGRAVVVAAVPGPGRADPGVAAGLAGLEAVAAGRSFDSELVRAVAAAIYARHDVGTPHRVPSAAPDDLLAAARVATRVLHRRADPADSAAYRQWVQSVAARVRRVVPPSVAAPQPPDADDRLFLDRLGRALRLR
ncbi:hypothetical protein ABT336_08625 [Micromonospora sp. NPDC000207]|uniref:hypothetical protein n=1 Tax=Micromonospora sp. NPDC000207 TaxID=3154246 RepID=UPI0033242CB8